MVNGVYSLESVARYCADAENPDSRTNHIITRVWPVGTMHVNRTDEDADKLRGLVADIVKTKGGR